jgi:hemolysin activation/secretion protein
VVQSIADVREAAIQTTRLALRDERLDDRLSPRRGHTVRVEASQSFTRQKLRDGERRSVRSSAADLALALHRPLGPRTGIAFEARAVGRIGSESVLPYYDRYPLGGAASLRGYDEEAFRVDRYALSRLEWRAFVAGGQYAFLFWDHATAATRLPTPTGDRQQLLNLDGYGAGLSLAASAGRVGVTYGVAAGSGPLEGKLHIQILTPF